MIVLSILKDDTLEYFKVTKCFIVIELGLPPLEVPTHSKVANINKLKVISTC